MQRFFNNSSKDADKEHEVIELQSFAEHEHIIYRDDALERLKVVFNTLANEYLSTIPKVLDLKTFEADLTSFIDSRLSLTDNALIEHFIFDEWLKNYARYQFISNYLFHFKNEELKDYLAILCEHQATMQLIYTEESSNQKPLDHELITKAKQLELKKHQSEAEHHRFFSKDDQEIIKTLHKHKTKLQIWLETHDPFQAYSKDKNRISQAG
jgi:hypothetical protein